MSNAFIERIAKVAVADWKERRIMLPSVVIAQAMKESAKGTSELAVNANAIFGIKLNGWTGKSYRKKADEQNPDGTMRTDENCLWRAYGSWEESVTDHNTYIAERRVGNQKEPNFEAIIGETNVKKVIAGLVGNNNRSEIAARCTDAELKKYVLEGTTTYGYATGLNYAQSLLDDYIIKYNLTQYDIIEERENVKMIKIAIDAGHGLYTSGKRCLKSLDANQTREWTLNDRIADRLEILLSSYNCEVLRMDDTTGLTDVPLKSRTDKANAWGADIYISIHHDAGANGGTSGGTTVFYYSSKAERKAQAQRLYECVIRNTGLVGNRSSKVKKHAYHVLRKSSMAAFLIENGFMDSAKDVPIILSEKHANKTANGILEFLIKELALVQIGEKKPTATETVATSSFKVKVIVDSLNYRTGASTKYPVKGTIKRNQIYTIVETSGNWGKLKSGAGWINISSKYVSRV